MTVLQDGEQRGLDRPPPAWAEPVISGCSRLSPRARSALASEGGTRDHRDARSEGLSAFRRLVRGIEMRPWDYRPAWVLAVIWGSSPHLHDPERGMTIPAALRCVHTAHRFEAQMRRLLDADRQELMDRLPGICRSIALAKGKLDMLRVAWALDGWGHPGRYVQQAWAQDAWPAELDGHPAEDQHARAQRDKLVPRNGAEISLRYAANKLASR